MYFTHSKIECVDEQWLQKGGGGGEKREFGMQSAPPFLPAPEFSSLPNARAIHDCEGRPGFAFAPRFADTFLNLLKCNIF